MSAVLVVEDGGSPYVLAAVRSLGRAGHRVGLASPVPNPRVTPSRFAGPWHPTRLPERDLDGFVADVREAVRTGGYDVVFGADDIEVLALSARRDELGARFPHAEHADVLRSVDKLTLTEAALSVGMQAPRTQRATPEALQAVDGPVVVKSRLHWTPGAPPLADRHLLVAVCPDAASATARVRELDAAQGEALLQQPVEGVQLAVSVVVDGAGEVRAVSQQETLQSSLSRTSSRAVTVAVDPALLGLVEALLRELRWVGLANLQFLRPDSGAPHLIDLNGRFYGSLALAVASGADLPAVWADVALDRPAGPCQTGRPGVRFHALHADLLRARRQRSSGLRADVADTLRFAVGATHSTWSVRDPRPGLALVGELAAGAARRVLPGRGRA